MPMLPMLGPHPRPSSSQADRRLACRPDGLPRFRGRIARGVHLYLDYGCPDRGHDLFNGLALCPVPWPGRAGGLDEQPPGWLEVERRGAARRTRLNGVHGTSSPAQDWNGPRSFWTCHWWWRPMSVSVSTRGPPPLSGSLLAYPTVMRPWKATWWSRGVPATTCCEREDLRLGRILTSTYLVGAILNLNK